MNAVNCDALNAQILLHDNVRSWQAAYQILGNTNVVIAKTCGIHVQHQDWKKVSTFNEFHFYSDAIFRFKAKLESSFIYST